MQFDTREIKTRQDFEFCLSALAERMPAVINDAAEARINDERKQAERGTFETIEKKLEMLSNFGGIVCDQPFETHDSRQKARHERALIARGFLNSYDFHIKGKKGNAPGTDFDPRLMRLICMAVRARDAYEACRGDIMAHIVVEPVQTPAPISTADELVLMAMPGHADK